MKDDQRIGLYGLENSDVAGQRCIEFLLETANAKAWLQAYAMNSESASWGFGGHTDSEGFQAIEAGIQRAEEVQRWAEELPERHSHVWKYLKKIRSYSVNWWPNTLIENLDISQTQYDEILERDSFTVSPDQMENLPKWLLRLNRELARSD